eukprot:928067-Prymnesium_polylepis.1
MAACVLPLYPLFGLKIELRPKYGLVLYANWTLAIYLGKHAHGHVSCAEEARQPHAAAHIPCTTANHRSPIGSPPELHSECIPASRHRRGRVGAL